VSSILTYGTIYASNSNACEDAPKRKRRTFRKPRERTEKQLHDSSVQNPCNDNQRSTGKVYFIQSHTSGFIKIGYTTNLIAQFKSLQNSSADFLVMLLHGDGTRALEGELHTRFAHLRVQGEWFRPGDDLLAGIADVRAAMGPDRVLQMDHWAGLELYLWQIQKMKVPPGRFYDGFEAEYD